MEMIGTAAARKYNYYTWCLVEIRQTIYLLYSLLLSFFENWPNNRASRYNSYIWYVLLCLHFLMENCKI